MGYRYLREILECHIAWAVIASPMEKNIINSTRDTVHLCYFAVVIRVGKLGANLLSLSISILI